MLPMPARLLPPLISVALFCSIAPHRQEIAGPRLVLWAWERPEDLRFINPATTGVAYLAATIEIQRDGSARFHYRQQPLRLPPNTSFSAVVRIETPPSYVFPPAAKIAAGLASIARRPGIRALQIDYDARSSEREFYKALLREASRQIRVPVGITALASWCDGDRWVSGQPVSEAVPMFFRMGPRESKDMAVRAGACQSSIGLSMDEPWPARHPAGLRPQARIYVFNPHPWTRDDYATLTREVALWR